MAAAQTAALCAQETALVRFFDNGKTVSQKTKDAPGTYLKFGDYLQAQDAQTGQQEAHENIRDFYRLRGIVSDRIVFENVKYERHE